VSELSLPPLDGTDRLSDRDLDELVEWSRECGMPDEVGGPTFNSVI